jgi:hypothetical protein
MAHRLRRELRLLRAHAFVSTSLLIVLLLAGFLQARQRTRFTEIDVERINIVEPDGKLRMVVSNGPARSAASTKASHSGIRAAHAPESSGAGERGSADVVQRIPGT